MQRKRLQPVLIITSLLLVAPHPALGEKTAEDYVQIGNDFYRMNNLDQAIYAYTKAIDIKPTLAKAYNNRGAAYAQEGSMSRAIADFTLAIANDFTDAEAFNNRGHAYAVQGDLTQAVIDYTQAINANALYTKAYKNRGVAYYHLKEYDKAWVDVFKVEELGGAVDHDFYLLLKKATLQGPYR